jgi:hypothetical protein
MPFLPVIAGEPAIAVANLIKNIKFIFSTLHFYRNLVTDERQSH